MLKLDIDAAERFVAGYPNASWNGWNLELFKPNPSGYSNKRGAFRNGTWGILTTVSPDSQGKYKFRV
jgi:hypothetical protein